MDLRRKSAQFFLTPRARCGKPELKPRNRGLRPGGTAHTARNADHRSARAAEAPKRVTPTRITRRGHGPGDPRPQAGATRISISFST